jgi:hypothetical protein
LQVLLCHKCGRVARDDVVPVAKEQELVEDIIARREKGPRAPVGWMLQTRRGIVSSEDADEIAGREMRERQLRWEKSQPPTPAQRRREQRQKQEEQKQKQGQQQEQEQQQKKPIIFCQECMSNALQKKWNENNLEAKPIA